MKLFIYNWFKNNSKIKLSHCPLHYKVPYLSLSSHTVIDFLMILTCILTNLLGSLKTPTITSFPPSPSSSQLCCHILTFQISWLELCKWPMTPSDFATSSTLSLSCLAHLVGHNQYLWCSVLTQVSIAQLASNQNPTKQYPRGGLWCILCGSGDCCKQ